ncbi:MAG TPA: transcription factor FapR [Thermaerobacter sp.]
MPNHGPMAPAPDPAESPPSPVDAILRPSGPSPDGADRPRGGGAGGRGDGSPRARRPGGRDSRAARQARLLQVLQENPFLTDAELADRFRVSVATIRLDRMRLGIPAVRERVRAVAERVHGRVRALPLREIVGELVDLELGRFGISILQTTPEMAFARTRMVRSQYILAQADSLALAVVDAELAFTSVANVKYKRPVQVGQRLVAKAVVLRHRRGDGAPVVLVQTRAGDEVVFRGKFVVQALAAPPPGATRAPAGGEPRAVGGVAGTGEGPRGLDEPASSRRALSGRGPDRDGGGGRP